jgi:hypothetical protein
MTAATAVPITPGDSTVSELDAWYVIDDREQVQHYLDRHPHLVPLLRDVVDAVRRYFRSDDVLHLEAIDDEETRTEQLYVIVSTSFSRGEAEAQLDRFDEEWWLDALDRTKGDLTVDVEAR